MAQESHTTPSDDHFPLPETTRIVNALAYGLHLSKQLRTLELIRLIVLILLPIALIATHPLWGHIVDPLLLPKEQEDYKLFLSLLVLGANVALEIALPGLKQRAASFLQYYDEKITQLPTSQIPNANAEDIEGTLQYYESFPPKQLIHFRCTYGKEAGGEPNKRWYPDTVYDTPTPLSYFYLAEALLTFDQILIRRYLEKLRPVVVTALIVVTLTLISALFFFTAETMLKGVLPIVVATMPFLLTYYLRIVRQKRSIETVSQQLKEIMASTTRADLLQRIGMLSKEIFGLRKEQIFVPQPTYDRNREVCNGAAISSLQRSILDARRIEGLTRATR